MSMELDEMKLAWQALDRRLEQRHALGLGLFRQGWSDRMRQHLRPLLWGQSLQIAFGVGAMLWGIDFWSTRLGDWKAMACGIAMQAFRVLMVAFAARLLYLLRGLDFAGPVLEIQRRLAAMRQWRVKVEAPLFVLLGSFMWIPAILMLILGETERAGVDLWRKAPALPLWLVLNGFLALALAALTTWAVRKAGRARWLENHFTGSAIRNAEAEWVEIERFERE
jgi:hypothetical protein